MIKEPLTFTTSVPQGKVWPMVLAIQPEAPHRAKLPRPPPIKIHSAFHIIPTAPRYIALVGVISTETDQAVFPCGKANPIADVIMSQLRPGWQPELHSFSGIP
jgi:hypothetical protein